MPIFMPATIMMAAAGISGTTLNPSDKGTNITLSGGNLTFSGATSWASVRSVASKTTGKHYFECTLGTDNYMAVGIANGSLNLNTDPNPGGNAWFMLNNGGTNYLKCYNDADNAQMFATTTSGDVLMVALDMDAGKVWFGLNGTWYNSGNPAAGTNHVYSGVTGTIYASAHSSGSGGGTMNFGSTALAYTAPSGFTAGWAA